MQQYIYTLFLVFGFLSSSAQSKSRNEAREVSMSNQTIEIDTAFIGKLNVGLNASTEKFKPKQISLLKCSKSKYKDIAIKLLKRINKLEIRESFFLFWRSKLKLFDTLSTNHFYLIEKDNEGEIVTHDYYLILKLKTKTKLIKFHCQYGEWTITDNRDISFDIDNYFKTLGYLTNFDQRDYKDLNSYVISSITVDSIISKAYSLINKKYILNKF